MKISLFTTGFAKYPIERAFEVAARCGYDGIDIGTRRVDFFIENRIMLKIKAVKELEDVYLAQAINYLEAYGMEIGLLINFGNTSLQFKRVMKSNQSPSKNHIKS